ncbi:right-handed parallel beta-helix repeat-containing protein [Dankookia sp. P2]|uniref:right-handed parallel beta-helix repeat-containing protein n=1 Tax=Dankookia sp. P2 TaxID=3423955 RepID=UPI003D67E4A8
MDVNCSGSLISGNLIEDNDVGGMLIELDYGALIQDNVIRRNNLSLADGFKGGGIYIQNSSNVIVRRNFVVGNGGGIWLYESNRGQGAQGPWVTQNNQIEDNIIAFTAGRNGFGGSAQHTPTNRFQRNTYYVAGAGSFFLGTPVDIAGWQKFGFDTPAGGSVVNLRPLSPDLP